MPATSSFVLRCATAVFAAVLLAGCTGEEAPSPTAAPTTPVASTPAASGSPTQAPTASSTAEPEIEKITTPPAVPVDLKTPGKVGSKAAVEYFVALYGYTLNTGDTSLLRAIAAPTCEYCDELMDNIETTHQAGWEVAGSGLRIEIAKLYEESSSEDEHIWLMDVEIAPSVETSPEGGRVERPREVHTTALVAVWAGGSWKIEDKRGVDESEAPAE